MDLDKLRKRVAYKEECLRAAEAAGLSEDAEAARSQLAELRESLASVWPASASAQHEIARSQLVKARRDLEQLNKDLAKARERYAAAETALTGVQAAVRAQELQIVDLEAVLRVSIHLILDLCLSRIVSFIGLDWPLVPNQLLRARSQGGQAHRGSIAIERLAETCRPVQAQIHNLEWSAIFLCVGDLLWRAQFERKRGKEVCRFWDSQGGCRNGNRCAYIHIRCTDETREEATAYLQLLSEPLQNAEREGVSDLSALRRELRRCAAKLDGIDNPTQQHSQVLDALETSARRLGVTLPRNISVDKGPEDILRQMAEQEGWPPQRIEMERASESFQKALHDFNSKKIKIIVWEE